MKKEIIDKIFIYLFVLFSLVVIVYVVLIIINQQVNIKYFFEDCLPDSNADKTPICQKDFFVELILYAKIIVLYAIYGLILSVYHKKDRS